MPKPPKLSRSRALNRTRPKSCIHLTWTMLKVQALHMGDLWPANWVGNCGWWAHVRWISVPWWFPKSTRQRGDSLISWNKLPRLAEEWNNKFHSSLVVFGQTDSCSNVSMTSENTILLCKNSIKKMSLFFIYYWYWSNLQSSWTNERFCHSFQQLREDLTLKYRLILREMSESDPPPPASWCL